MRLLFLCVFSLRLVSAQLSVTDPKNGATVSGVVEVKINQTNDISCRLLLDGHSVAGFKNGVVKWDSVTVTNGKHTLATKCGEEMSLPITVTVENKKYYIRQAITPVKNVARFFVCRGVEFDNALKTTYGMIRVTIPQKHWAHTRVWLNGRELRRGGLDMPLADFIPTEMGIIPTYLVFDEWSSKGSLIRVRF